MGQDRRSLTRTARTLRQRELHGKSTNPKAWEGGVGCLVGSANFTTAANEGSRILNQAAAEAGGEAMRERGLSEEECEARSQAAVRLNLGQYLHHGYHGPRWTAEDLALLGTLPDAEVAARIGRTALAVRVMRTRLGIPTARDGRRSS